MEAVVVIAWLGLVVLAILGLAAYVQSRNERLEMLCWIPEPHPWHEGCWQIREEER